MAVNLEGLRESDKRRTDEAREKAAAAISELLAQGKKVNFNSVSNYCGVAKTFLYDDKQTRESIEAHRQYSINKDTNKRAKYDKTSSSKDVMIKAKDKRIAKLEEEIKKLRTENEHLRGKLYELS